MCRGRNSGIHERCCPVHARSNALLNPNPCSAASPPHSSRLLLLPLDCMPTITAGMVEAVEAQAAVEAEAKLNAEKPTIEGMIMTDRPDLYSDKWSGDTYTGSNWNELTGLLAVGIAVPVLGLIFALATRGTLWGVVSFY